MAKAPPKEPTLGELIDQLDEIRVDKRKAEEAVKVFDERYKALEGEIQTKMLAEKMELARGKRASVSISRNIVGSIKDWDTLTNYVKKTGYFHLFNRSVGAASFRELYEQAMTKVVAGKSEEITLKRRQEAEDKFIALTGVAPFEKISLKHSSIKAS